MARDPGNRLNQARSIAIAATPKRLRQAIGSGDPADFYRFSLSQRSSSSFSLGQLRANADLALLNSQGGIIAQSRRTGNRSEQISTSLEGGTYFLRVTPRRRQDSTRYLLQYSAIADSPSPSPNPSPSPSPNPSPNPNPAPSNTNPSIVAAGVSIPRGTSATLNSDQLRATDAEQPVPQLVYTLTSLPQNGSLLFDNAAAVLGRTFTQADIAAGRLSYTNRGSTRQLTANPTDNRNPAISGANLVWQGRGGINGSDFDIFFSSGGNPSTPLTTNATDDINPQISGANVVWQGTGANAGIFLSIGGGAARQLALPTSSDNRSPQISGTNVAWYGRGGRDQGSDYEIFYWNGTTVAQLTENDSDDVNVQISGTNLVWQGLSSDGQPDQEIFFFNGSIVTQLTTNTTDDELPQISGSNIVWQGVEGSDSDIFFSNGNANPLPLTANTVDDRNPQISGSNIVWQSGSGSNSTIFLATAGNNSAPAPLSAASGLAVNPQISGTSVVWQGTSGTSGSGTALELFFSTGSGTPIPLTANSTADNVTPRISGANVVWSQASAGVSNSQIFFRNQASQDSFGFTVTDGAGGSTAGTFNFSIG